MKGNSIVWVFGCSAVGKETFVRNVQRDKNMLEKLGWNNKNISIVEESLKYIKQTENDPIGIKRKEIIDIACDLSNKLDNSVILIKGQNVDLYADFPWLLKNKVNSVCEIVFLHSDINTVFERGKNKSWFREEYNDKNRWLNHMIRTARKVLDFSDIKITSIDSTNIYKITEFPEYR